MLIMTCQFSLFIFLFIFSLTKCLHFLGGSFTYQQIQQAIDYQFSKPILVEIRFHISNHLFMCTPEQINEHRIVYLIGEDVLYDNVTETYLWKQAMAIQENQQYYYIKCLSNKQNEACHNFREEIWAYCESANENSGYSILRRQFLLIVEKFKPLNLYYSACCWANSSNKNFHFHLSIETDLNRINSSPYPHIPASYYVAFNQSNVIKIFAFDADDDEVICEPYQDLSGFLTVNVDNDCRLNYKINRLGKQFGQFWLMDRSQHRILSRSLISIQVHVLENIICKHQPELILHNKFNHSDKVVMKLNESIDLLVRLHPNCALIKPQDQTITELTTSCTNNQPIVLANGGIETRFQCQFNLCKKYQICFVGEVGLKLPATNIECFLIEVTDTKDECAKANSKYDFYTPRNRHVILTEPIYQKQIVNQSSSESQTRRWLSVFFAHIAFLLVCIIGYCGCKQMLLLLFNNCSRRNSSDRNRIGTMIESNPVAMRPSRKLTDPLLSKHEPGSSKKTKVRTQYFRLGSTDHVDK